MDQMDTTVKVITTFMESFIREAEQRGVPPGTLLQEKRMNGDVRRVAQSIHYKSNEDYLRAMDAELRENTNKAYERLDRLAKEQKELDRLSRK